MLCIVPAATDLWEGCIHTMVGFWLCFLAKVVLQLSTTQRPVLSTTPCTVLLAACVAQVARLTTLGCGVLVACVLHSPRCGCYRL